MNGYRMDLEWILGQMTGNCRESLGMDLEWISNGFGMDLEWIFGEDQF